MKTFGVLAAVLICSSLTISSYSYAEPKSSPRAVQPKAKTPATKPAAPPIVEIKKTPRPTSLRLVSFEVTVPYMFFAKGISAPALGLSYTPSILVYGDSLWLKPAVGMVYAHSSRVPQYLAGRLELGLLWAGPQNGFFGEAGAGAHYYTGTYFTGGHLKSLIYLASGYSWPRGILQRLFLRAESIRFETDSAYFSLGVGASIGL